MPTTPSAPPSALPWMRCSRVRGCRSSWSNRSPMTRGRRTSPSRSPRSVPSIPDLVLTVTRAADAIKLVRDMVRQRFEPKGIISPGSPGLYDEEFFQALGPLADYPIYNLPWADPKAPMSQALEAAFKPANPSLRFPVECFNVCFTFEALLIAADGFKRAGTANGPELMRAIRSTDIASHVMIGPPIKFDEKGQNVGIPSACVQSRNRIPTVVLPAASATMAPVLPMPGWQRRG